MLQWFIVLFTALTVGGLVGGWLALTWWRRSPPSEVDR
jgi:hypothetical protein